MNYFCKNLPIYLCVTCVHRYILSSTVVSRREFELVLKYYFTDIPLLISFFQYVRVVDYYFCIFVNQNLFSFIFLSQCWNYAEVRKFQAQHTFCEALIRILVIVSYGMSWYYQLKFHKQQIVIRILK